MKLKWAEQRLRLFSFVAWALTIFVNPATAQNTLSNNALGWSSLPAVGSRAGAWVISERSMPSLLDDKYDLFSTIPTTASFISSELAARLNMSVYGWSYFLKKSADLFRCDEVGTNKAYVMCWHFQPETFGGIASITTANLIGLWKTSGSPAVTIEFTSSTISVDGKTLPYTVTTLGNIALVKVDNKAQAFAFQSVSVMLLTNGTTPQTGVTFTKQ